MRTLKLISAALVMVAASSSFAELPCNQKNNSRLTANTNPKVATQSQSQTKAVRSSHNNSK